LNINSEHSSAIAEKPCDCCVGHIWPKVEEDILLFCRHYKSIFNHCDVIGLQSNSVK